MPKNLKLSQTKKKTGDNIATAVPNFAMFTKIS